MRVSQAFTVGPLFAIGLCTAACGPSVKPGSGIAPETGRPAASGFTGSDGGGEVYTPTAGLPGKTKIMFQLPRGGNEPLMEHPWPSELDRRADGTIDFTHFPGQEHFVIAKYIQEAERSVSGFSLSQSAYFRFEGGEPRVWALPTYQADTMRKTSPIFLVDVDAKSPTRGSFIPLDLRYVRDALAYLPAKALAAKPMLGFTLRPKTLYAYVVRRDLADDTSAPLGTSNELEMIKWTSPRPNSVEEAARKLHLETFAYLSDVLEVKREEIAAVAVFRTGDPTAFAETLLQHALSLSGASAPVFTDAQWDGIAGKGFYVVRGHYCTPNYQAEIDAAPFTYEGGGTFRTDSGGKPVLQNVPALYRKDSSAEDRDADCTPLMKARFVLTVPSAVMPMSGWPIIVSAHGTGLDAASFARANDLAEWAAKQGYAVIATDLPLHGVTTDPGRRPGSDKNVQFDLGGASLGFSFRAQDVYVNPVNPGAGRDNVRQAMVDASLLLKLLGQTDFATATQQASTKILLEAYGGRTSPRFDTTRTILVGHALGSQSAALQAAIDPAIKGAVLSACGADVRAALLGRTRPVEMRNVMQQVFGTAATELDALHPVMSLAQMIADPADPQSYAPLYRDPLPGHAPQNVLHVLGISDADVARASGEAFSVALRATQLEPTQGLIEGLSLLSVRPQLGPIRANNGPHASIAVLEVPSNADGRFALSDDEKVRAVVEKFFATIKADGVAEIGPY